MTDDCADAFDRLDQLHRTYPLPHTCPRCRQRATTTDLCGSCALDIRLMQGWSA